MRRYRAALAHTAAPHDVVFQVYSATPDNRGLMRFALASAMLDDGHFAFNSDAAPTVPWFEEYEAPVGKPLEPPPTAAAAGGVWVRRYENGLVLVNPDKTSTRSIDIGNGYKHLDGTQDRAVNNGLSERVVSLPPRSGVLMLKG